MFVLALLIGIYSYIIFLVGLINFIYKPILILVNLAFIFIAAFFIRRTLKEHNLKGKVISFVKKSTKLELIFLVIILFQGLINLIGALGPELGFDALWYHLTLPKLYLQNHAIVHIPGSLLYYSDMPRLAEMLYTVVLAMSNEIGVKLTHFSFGILSLVALYKLSRKFLPKKFSLLALVLFYSNIVVGWMSITAYVDLARTFFEIMALWGFVEWQEKKDSKWLIESAVILGLAISTKLLALGSLVIFTALIIIYVRKIIYVLIYLFFALLIPLPWFISSFTHTGNLLYPFFTNLYPIKFNVEFVNPLNLSDPISSLYVIFLPLAIFLYRKFKPSLKIMTSYSLLAIMGWYLIPQTGGGRFILPYLPAFSVVSVAIIEMIKKTKVRNILVGLIICLALFSIIYRGGANLKYVSVILGKESKARFLTNHLNFSYGDFYDTDKYFAKKIKQNDTVLLYGFHNLYYVDFPFIDSSYVKKGDTFSYIAVQGGNIPERFKVWNLIYYNTKTNVKLYSVGGIKWVY